MTDGPHDSFLPPIYLARGEEYQMDGDEAKARSLWPVRPATIGKIIGAVVFVVLLWWWWR